MDDTLHEISMDDSHGAPYCLGEKPAGAIRRVVGGLVLMVIFAFGVGCQSPRQSTEIRDSDVADGPWDTAVLWPGIDEATLTRMACPLASLELPDIDDLFDPNQALTCGRGALWSVAPDPNAPDEVPKLYLRARAHLNQNRYEAARDALLRAIQIHSDPQRVGRVYELLSRASFGLRDMVLGTAAARCAIQGDADRLLGYFFLGNQAVRDGQVKRALALYQRALACSDATEGNPLTLVLWLQQAMILSQQGYLTAASEAYEHCQRLLRKQHGYSHTSPVVAQLSYQPHTVPLALGTLYARLGQFSRAYATIESSMSSDDLAMLPVDFTLMFLYGLTPPQRSDPNAWAVHDQMLLYTLQHHERSEYLLAGFYQWCRQMAQQDHYRDQLSQWTQRAHLSDGLLLYGWSLTDQDAAFEAVLHSVLSRPGDPRRALRIAGDYFVRRGDYARAVTYQRRCYEEALPDAQLLAEIIDNHVMAQQDDAALAFLAQQQSVTALQTPQAVYVLYRAAVRLYRVTGQFAQATATFALWDDLLSYPFSEPNVVMDSRIPVDANTPSTHLDEVLGPIVRGYRIMFLCDAGQLDVAASVTGDFLRVWGHVPVGPLDYLVSHWIISGSFDTALAQLDAWVGMFPDEPLFRYQRARVRIDADQAVPAIASLRGWQQADPTDFRRIETLMNVLEFSGDFAASAQVLGHYLQANPTAMGVGGTLYLARLHALGGAHDEAVATLASLSESLSFEATARLRIDLALYSGNTDSALVLLDTIVPLDCGVMADQGQDEKSFIAHRLWRASVLRRAGRDGQLLGLLNETLDCLPDSVQVNMAMAFHLLATPVDCNTHQATVYLRRALVESGYDPAQKNNLGYTLLQAGHNLLEAKELLNSSWQEDPSSSATLDSLAWLDYKQGNYRRAADRLMRAAAMDSLDDPEIMIHLAQAFARDGRVDQARWCWIKARRLLDIKRKEAFYPVSLDESITHALDPSDRAIKGDPSAFR